MAFVSLSAPVTSRTVANSLTSSVICATTSGLPLIPDPPLSSNLPLTCLSPWLVVGLCDAGRAPAWKDGDALDRLAPVVVCGLGHSGEPEGEGDLGGIGLSVNEVAVDLL